MSSIAMSDSTSLPSVSRHQLLVEHVRIDSEKPYLETRAALETLPRFDERIRAHLQHGDIEYASKLSSGPFRVMLGLLSFPLQPMGTGCRFFQESAMLCSTS